MADGNPIVIQKQRFQASSVPLVLIHDGGGTIANYFLFGDLGRDVYGIYNPLFEDDPAQTMSIEEMAEEYSQLLMEVLPNQKIILGGWSLGGLVSLQIAELVVDDPRLNIAGILLIESIFPGALDATNGKIVESDLYFDAQTNPTMRKRVTRHLHEAAEMVSSFKAPEFDGVTPPPAIVMHAKDSMPSRKGSANPPMLGWDQYEARIVKSTYEIPGHHFSIFARENIDQFTTTLREVCTLLESELWS